MTNTHHSWVVREWRKEEKVVIRGEWVPGGFLGEHREGNETCL